MQDGCGCPALSLAATALLAATAVPAAADHTADHVVTKDKWGGTLRIAVADSDLPMADIQQNGGWMPGQSLVGNQVYNGLTCWNFVGEEGRIPAGAPEPMPCHAESLEWGRRGQSVGMDRQNTARADVP